MKKLSLLTAAVALTAVGAHADWLLSDYATAAADSTEVRKLYGAQTFGSAKSPTTLTGKAGSLVFEATYASDGTKGYTANVGLMQPLTTDWAGHDITGLTKITFEYKNSALITDALSVTFGSTAYSEKIARAGTVYGYDIKGDSARAIHSDWTVASVDAADIALPDWFLTSKPADYPELAEVLKGVKNVQIGPKTKYKSAGTQDGKACDECVGPTMSNLTLEIRKITLVGVTKTPWPNPLEEGCEDATKSTVLDEFLDGNEENQLGGYWYTFTDSGSAAVAGDLADKAKGSSTATLDITEGGVGFTGVATLKASLNKKLGTVWHDYAGWAAIGVGFAGDGLVTGMDALTGIRFKIKGVAIDPTIETINFKVSAKGISDTALHFVSLPVAELVAADEGKVACIRPSDLNQAAYLQAAHKSELVPADILKLAWEAKITDQSLQSISTASASFWISDVSLYGKAGMVSGTRNHKSKAVGFSVRSQGGLLSLSGYQGIQSFDVVALDGKKVTSFAPAPTVALSLPRGSYFLVGKRDGASLTKSFAVVR